MMKISWTLSTRYPLTNRLMLYWGEPKVIEGGGVTSKNERTGLRRKESSVWSTF